jgi:hypothetical protein
VGCCISEGALGGVLASHVPARGQSPACLAGLRPASSYSCPQEHPAPPALESTWPTVPCSSRSRSLSQTLPPTPRALHPKLAVTLYGTAPSQEELFQHRCEDAGAHSVGLAPTNRWLRSMPEGSELKKLPLVPECVFSNVVPGEHHTLVLGADKIIHVLVDWPIITSEPGIAVKIR